MFAFGSKDVPAGRGGVPRRDARRDEVRRARGVLPELHPARQVRAPRAVRRGADHDRLRHQGQAHLDRPQSQDGRAAAQRHAGRVRGRRPHGDLRGARAGQRGASRRCGVGRGHDRGPDRRRLARGRRARGDPRGVRQPARRSTRPPPRSTRPWSRSREALDAHGGLLVEHEGKPVGALLLEPRGRLLGLRRVGVLDTVRGLGVAAKMASRAEEIAAARKFGGLEIEARVELPKTIDFWRTARVRRVRPQRQPAEHAEDAADHAGPAHRRGHPRLRRVAGDDSCATATW